MAGGVFSEANLFGMTIRESANDGSDFTNPPADYRRLFVGEDGLFHLKDSAGTVTTPSASAGAATASGLTMATARILGRTTASTGAIEEITVGSGLSLAAGALTATGGAGISSGTSNPGSPANGDLFYRSDLDLFIRYRSSGTRWVCTCLHGTQYSLQTSTSILPLTVNGSIYAPYDANGQNLWVETVNLTTLVPSGTNNGGNFWTITTTWGAPTTAADGNAAASHDHAAGAVVGGPTFGELTIAKTGTPGALYIWGQYTYRRIVT